MESRAVRCRTICAAVVIGALLVACGSDGLGGEVANLPAATIDGGEAPVEPVEPEAPAEPEVPAEPVEPEAPTEPVEPAEPGEPAPNPIVPDEDDWTDLLLTLLVIGALIGAVVVIGTAIAKSRKKASDPAVARSAAPSPQSSLLSTSQWIADQLTLELMAAPPAAALQRWAVERSRLDNVAIGAQQQYLAAQNPNWQPLAQTMSALAGALDTSLALRAQDPPNPQLISDSIDVVNGHRARVHELVAALLPTIEG